MEMHQVRYFLATVSELNFTKAAERCNVTQPSLTRAIKQLEDELGGDLFRRERPQAQLTELNRLFSRLEIKLLRGTAGEILELLKKGDAELAIAAEIGEEWDRLDRWPLFSEEFGLILNASHALAARSAVDIEDLRQERWLRRSYCEHVENAAALIRGHNLAIDQGHELGSDQDLITLI